MTRFSRAALAAVGMLALAGCSTTAVEMKYAPSAASPAPGAARPIVYVAEIKDQRPHAPNYLGSVLNGFGSPMKTLETTVPVNQVVGDAFSDALRARGLLAPSAGGPYGLAVTILKLDCSQYVRREAHVDFTVALSDRASGRELYRDSFKVELVEGSLIAFDTGLFASTEDLRAVALKAMQQAIDAALDSPGVRQAINPA